MLPLRIPPLDEQRAIAEYLNRETERIDALVEKERQLIERLQEYRTALIARTVTSGIPCDAACAADLDTSPRLKPSGVEWLGDVPEHWEVGNIRRYAEMKSGHTQVVSIPSTGRIATSLGSPSPTSGSFAMAARHTWMRLAN